MALAPVGPTIGAAMTAVRGTRLPRRGVTVAGKTAAPGLAAGGTLGGNMAAAYEGSP